MADANYLIQAYFKLLLLLLVWLAFFAHSILSLIYESFQLESYDLLCAYIVTRKVKVSNVVKVAVRESNSGSPEGKYDTKSRLKQK